MKFHKIDAILSLTALLMMSALAFVSARFVWLQRLVHADFAGLLACGVFVAVLVALSVFVGRVLQTLNPLKSGQFSMETVNARTTTWKLMGFLNLFNISPLIHTGLLAFNLRWIIYRSLGCRIGKNVMMGGKLIEPLMVEIGDDVTLGEDSLLLGHAIEGASVTLGTVRIGNGVTIGARAILMPDVEIGDGAVVGTGSLVTKGTKIAAGETWVGVPARRLITKAPAAS